MATNLSNVQRVGLVHNKALSRVGIKHYAHALLKYDIIPTVPGPFQVVKEIEKLESTATTKPAVVAEKVQQTLGLKRKNVVHHTLCRTNGAGQTGKVSAQDADHGSEYLAPVTIGTPGKTFNLDFDTGSADLWVFGSKVPAAQQGIHAVYDPASSSTAKAMDGSTWSITYGDQSSASGTVSTDTITLGGLSIHDQAIESADTVSSEFSQQSSDGLLGLAFGSINTVKPQSVATPVENMMVQKDIPVTSQLFTAWFEPPTGNSWYSFGYIDQTALGGVSPSYTPQFPSPIVKVGDKTINLGRSFTNIADTGTTLTLLPDHACQSIYASIPGAHLDQQNQGWVFPSTATLPPISFAIGSTLFQMNPSDLALQDLGNGTIYGGIQSSGNLPLGILGDTFLRGIYAIFDQGNKRFGAVQRSFKGEGMSSGVPIPMGKSGGCTAGDRSGDLHEFHGHEKLGEEHPAGQGKHWYDSLLHPKIEKGAHDPQSDYSRRSSG